MEKLKKCSPFGNCSSGTNFEQFAIIDGVVTFDNINNIPFCQGLVINSLDLRAIQVGNIAHMNLYERYLRSCEHNQSVILVRLEVLIITCNRRASN